MDRAIPVSGNEEIDLYMRTYYSLLRSSGEIEVRALEETHSGMNASLHQNATGAGLDLGAFLYCALRLPARIDQVRLVLLGQSTEVFSRGGYGDVETWTTAKSPARRRKMFFDGRETLGVFINSISDIDDLIPMLTTYQIEWNKMHYSLGRAGLAQRDSSQLSAANYQAGLGLTEAEFAQLENVWGERLLDCLGQVRSGQKRFALQLLSGSVNDYRRATQGWWRSIVSSVPVSNMRHRPVYFVSSNVHAFPNLFSNYATLIEDEIISFLDEVNPEGLRETYQQLQQGDLPGSPSNLRYYVMRKYLRTPAGHHHYEPRLRHEISLGIHNVRRPLNLDSGAQIIEMAKLNPAHFDPRLQIPDAKWENLRYSKAVIVNVDYPLGMAAYQVLSQVSASVGPLLGFYIMGKAATLNGRVGDVMIPNIVYDEHSRNTFLFQNCFETRHVAPFLQHGAVFDNQKAVTVRGTLLQNRDFMHLFYREGYTDIEMEAGPYLSAMYENLYPKRYPINEIVNLFLDLSYDLGILHYASDTPYSKRQSLLSKSLLYFGMDATYASAIAIARRILEHELAGNP